jgi:hypothetical protein
LAGRKCPILFSFFILKYKSAALFKNLFLKYKIQGVLHQKKYLRASTASVEPHFFAKKPIKSSFFQMISGY